VKQIIFVFFYYLFFISGINNPVLGFDGYKPLKNINIYIGAPVYDAYNSVTKYSSKDCSVLFHSQDKKVQGIINFNINEHDVLNYASTKEVNFTCEILYNFNNSSKTGSKEEALLFYSTCRGLISKIEIMTFLNLNQYGKDPEILNEWVSRFKKLSSKSSPRIELSEKKEKFNNQEYTYDVERRLWMDDIYYKNDNIGFIQVQSYIKKNKNQKLTNLTGSNRLTFQDYSNNKIDGRYLKCT
jgi:hypothetical protein